jgi:hypothetical protein
LSDWGVWTEKAVAAALTHQGIEFHDTFRCHWTV